MRCSWIARRALLHLARAASDAMRASSNSLPVATRSLLTAMAYRSVLAAYSLTSRTFSSQTISDEDNPNFREAVTPQT